MSTLYTDHQPNDKPHHTNGLADTDASIWSEAPGYWQRKVVPVKEMTAKQRNAALKKFSTRWGKHHDEAQRQYHGTDGAK